MSAFASDKADDFHAVFASLRQGGELSAAQIEVAVAALVDENTGDDAKAVLPPVKGV